MKDSTALKVAGIVSITGITISTVLIGHIDGAFAASMAGIIGGICGYSIKNSGK